MTSETVRRRTLRAAIRIREHLAGSGHFSLLPILYEHEWHELSKEASRFELVRTKGWNAAAESLLRNLNYSAANLRRRLETFLSQLPKIPAPEQIASPREIADDITALAEEFEELEIDLQKNTLSVVTSSIELEETYLGAFSIVLRWKDVGSVPCYNIIARDPQPAEENDKVTHPHVSEQRLCEGEGSTAIRSALAQGRLLDFFVLVKQILETYNPGSAYVSLSRWSGGSDCSDCGYNMSEDESWGCDRCGSTLCDDCRHCCQECDVTLCSGCYLPCHDCEETFCRRCLVTRPGTQNLVCKSCLEEGEPTDDDNETPAESEAGEPSQGGAGTPADPAHAVCLEEAAVPA